MASSRDEAICFEKGSERKPAVEITVVVAHSMEVAPALWFPRQSSNHHCQNQNYRYRILRVARTNCRFDLRSPVAHFAPEDFARSAARVGRASSKVRLGQASVRRQTAIRCTFSSCCTRESFAPC